MNREHISYLAAPIPYKFRWRVPKQNMGKFQRASMSAILLFPPLPVGQLSALAALRVAAKSAKAARSTTFHVHVGAGRLGLGLVRAPNVSQELAGVQWEVLGGGG